MKMKNIIRATRPGKIGTVLVVVGDHVKHGQVLLSYAD
jgi:biotin carboxyl carrier protein